MKEHYILYQCLAVYYPLLHKKEFEGEKDTFCHLELDGNDCPVKITSEARNIKSNIFQLIQLGKRVSIYHLEYNYSTGLKLPLIGS